MIETNGRRHDADAAADSDDDMITLCQAEQKIRVGTF